MVKSQNISDGCLFLKPSLCFYLYVAIFSYNLVVQVTTAEQQRAFCRIGAIIRGFLTRRLLKTEKVKHLRQTIKVILHISHK